MAVVVNVVGNFDDKELKRAQRELAKLGSSSGKTSKQFSTSFGKMAKSVAGVAGAVLGIRAIAKGLENLAIAAQESAAVSATTTAIIKSTGGAAKVTADQVGKLATALSNKTGIDDEQIQSASNLLLTFKQVRNEVGKGNAIFNRATKAALDLSKAGFGSTDSAAKMLGKALNDPIKGVSALSRAGVTFTQQQKDQIKTLVESGKTLDAQKLIMKEVESEVGGVAEATASPIERLKVIVGNFKEDLGANLLPVISQVADAIGPILQQLAGPLGQVIGTVATSLAKVFQPLLPMLKPIGEALGTVASAVGSALTTAFQTLVPALMPILNILAKLVADVVPILAPLLARIAVVIAEILKAVTPLLAPLAKLVVGILKQAAPILDLAIDAVLAIIKALKPLFPVIVKLLQPLGRLVFALLKAIMPILRPLLPIITKLADLFASELADTINLVTDALNALLPWIEKALKWIGDFAGGIVDAFGNFPDGMLDVGKNIVTGIWNGIVNTGGWFKDKIVEWAGNMLPGWVKDVLGIQSPSRVFMEIGKFIPAGMAEGIVKAAGSVKKAAEEMGKAAIDAATEALSKFKDKAREFFDLRNQIAESMRGAGSLGSISLGGDGFAPTAAGITGYLSERLRKIKEFGQQLAELKRLNLNNASLQEIIAAGPDSGSQIAAALLAEGQKAVSQVNTLEAQLSIESKRIGTTGAESQFGMSAANARGMQTTNVTLKDGAVVVNFGAGIGKGDADAITATIEQAIKKALVAAAKDAKR